MIFYESVLALVALRRMSVVDFVLQAPRKEAKDDFEAACVEAADAVESLLKVGLEKTQNLFNR